MHESKNQLAFNLLIVSIGLIGPLGVAAPRGLVPLLILAAICAFFSNKRLTTDRGVSLRVFGLFLAAFAGWGLLTALWSLEPTRTVTLTLKLVALSLVGLLLIRMLAVQDSDRHRIIGQAIIYSTVLGLIILIAGILFARFTGDSLWGIHSGDPYTTLSRGADVMALMIWPAAVILWKNKRTIVLTSLVAIMTLSFLALSNAAVISALFAGLAVFLAVMLVRKLPIPWIGGVIAVALLASPLLVRALPSGEVMNQKVGTVYMSAVHRIYTWHFVNERIFEKPISGWGLDASRFIPGGHEKLNLDPLGIWGAEILPLHPHNQALQIWLELGLPGAFIFAAFIFYLFTRIPKRSHDLILAASMAAASVIYMTIGSLAFGLWQNWWVATGWLVAGLMVAGSRKEA